MINILGLGKSLSSI